MPFPFNIIDLTHTLDSAVPTWNGTCGFKQEITADYEDFPTTTPFRVQQLFMHAGIATHMDAPAHCTPEGACIHELDLKNLMTTAIVIDISDKADAQYTLSTKDIYSFEERHGMIPENSFVMIHTGWERFWHHPKQYRNEGLFPSISADAAYFLLERQVVGLGIDTLSPDRPESDFPVHKIILGAGKYIVENITNATHLPATGSYSMALPIKTLHGTEAPIRLIGLSEYLSLAD